MKYIMFEVELDKQKVRIPIIFPNTLVHRELALALQHCITRHLGSEPKVVSAGECIIEANTVAGESKTLKVKSGKTDKQIINTNDYMHGLI